MKLIDAEEFLECCSGKTDALLFCHRHKQDVWANRVGIGWLTASGNSLKSPRLLRSLLKKAASPWVAWQ